MAKLIASTAPPGLPWQARRAGEDYGKRDTPDWRSIDWRPHLHQVEIGGRSVNYVDYGESRDGQEAVVFIHGLGGCWQNWLENIPRIAASGRRAIGIDLPGFGFSEMPAEKISISGYGRCVNELSDMLDLGEVALVGNSMGGFTAAETAIQFPERVARLVLNSAAGITTSQVVRRPLMAGARFVAMVGTRTAAMTDRLVVRRRLRHPVYMTFIRHPGRIPTDLLYEITQGAGRPGFVDALDAITSYDFSDRLPEIRCPTLVVWGKEDMLVPLHDANTYADLIPNARKVVFDDTGHSAMIERPPTFNSCVLEFLAEEPTPAHSEAEVEAASSNGSNARVSS